MKWFTIKSILTASILLVAIGCGPEFDPASKIESQRFLAIAADPLEAAPGEEILFTALVTEKNGTLYDGPIAWAVAGGNALREEGDESDVDPNDVAIQMPEDEGFVWTVPDVDELDEKFGPMQENGMLLTVYATLFEGGDLENPTKPSFKLFVVSEREADQRMTNPVLESMKATVGGKDLEVDENGDLISEASTVKFRAVPDMGYEDLSYHWFATISDFDPDFGPSQTFDPHKTGVYGVYCVIRQMQFFEHDDGSKTRMTGIDWWQGYIRFQ